MPPLIGQFAHLGCSQEPRSVAIMQRSYSEYEYFASGRRNCLYADFKLAMRRRHCLLTTYTYDLFYGTPDTLTVEIPIDLGGRDLPLEFFICRRKDLKHKLSQMSYLDDFVKNSNAKNYRLSEKQLQEKNALMIMSEHDEVANQLVDAKVGELLLKYGGSGMLHELHVTDQRPYNNYPLFLRAVIELAPSAAEVERTEESYQLLLMAIYMVDLVAGLKLSPTVSAKCEKSRKKIKQALSQQKREEQEEKRAEARREQDRLERERLKRMTPEQQRKYEEKQCKKEQAKHKNKFMKVAKV